MVPITHHSSIVVHQIFCFFEESNFEINEFLDLFFDISICHSILKNAIFNHIFTPIVVRSKKKIEELIHSIKLQSEERDRNIKKQDLLREVPCGSQFPSCKFIKDAHKAGELIQICESKISTFSSDVNKVGINLRENDPDTIESHIGKYNLLLEKRNVLATSIANN
mgnify:CR=1 FL=1